MHRRHGSTASWKDPLAWEDLQHVLAAYSSSPSHDDLLFVGILLTGFCALLCLGELTLPNNKALRNFSKCPLRSSCRLTSNQFDFWLPYHKSNTFFEGNRVVVLQHLCRPDTLTAMRCYLVSRDTLFPLHPWLWMTASGCPPTHAWFICRMCCFFPSTISGHSLRAGSATAMAEDGATPDLFRATG